MHCAKIENGIVTQVIVCSSAAWAAQHLGGEWVYTDTLPGIGWAYADGQFVSPESPEDEE